MVSVCCFDKTGTLTAEEYKLVGVDNLHAPPANKKARISGNYFTKHSEMPKEALWVLGGCHSLVRDKYGNLIGDSIEEAGFTAMRFKLNPDKSSQLDDMVIQPLKEYHFSSELRRMSVVCKVTGEAKPIVVIKGAPEAIEELLTEVPEGYRDCYRSYTRQGCRVLALGYREYEKNEFNNQEKRASVEKDFKFIGFSIFSAAIKRGSEDTIVNLLQSTHRVIVITGDDPLTACHVAKCLHIINKKPAIHDLTITDENGEELKSDEGYAPCYTGRCLQNLSPEEFTEAVKKCNVFARMSPSDKSSIIICLNELGEKTLMCGDGTNDVGALKHAHVGIGLLEQAVEASPETDLIEQSGYKTKLGAASIASPFVSKRPTISACADLIRTGRACLSSASDLFRQLSLNALFTAYIEVVLMLENIRLNDRQITSFSMLLTVVQFSIAFAKPRRQLSTERPFPSIFNGYLVSSILIQFGVHFSIFILLHKMVFASGYKVDKFNYHSRFAPGLLNTCAFIYESVVQIVITVVNYRGKPFMQGFAENKLLLIGTFLGFGFIFIMLLDIVPFFRKYFKTVPFPSRTFQFEFILLMVADLVLSFVGDRICLKFYSNKQKKHTDGLVDPEIIESLEDYITNDDDVLPEDLYEFGFGEMMKQNLVMQQNVAKKEREHMMNEVKKNEYKKKIQEETKQ
jgi:cation-transporting ATPase 13A1